MNFLFKSKKMSFLIALCVLVSLFISSNAFAATSYTYMTNTSRGITVNAIRTTPGNIEFKTLGETQSLHPSGYYGINGGWFPGGVQTYSIAIKNGVPVVPASARAGNFDGRYNLSSTPLARGTIVWNGTSFSLQHVRSYDKITGIGSNYWAQGGVSMNLGDPNWKTRAGTDYPMTGEGLPFRDQLVAGRSAMVVRTVNTTTKYVYLITTQNSCTAETFRLNIEDFFSINDSQGLSTTKLGIFLDGSGSSQLECKDSSGNLVSKTGDGRHLVQIISLINKN